LIQHSSRDDLLKVARSLGDFRDRVVFVGGCAVVFLVPDSVVPTIRPTEDVDCILYVPSRASYYLEVVEPLRSLGFSECVEPGSPICRWVVEGVAVDVMPTSDEILGFSNRWYDFAIQDPLVLEPLPDLQIRVIGQAAFLATKFEAFANRGQGEYEGNTDIEDIISVTAYCPDLADRIRQAPMELQDFLQLCASGMLALSSLPELISAALPGDRVSQSSIPSVIHTFRLMASKGELA